MKISINNILFSGFLVSLSYSFCSLTLADSDLLSIRDIATYNLWSTHAPTCQSTTGGPFDPSMFDYSETDKKQRECAASDMTLFNGLLCASGENRGCNAVKRAQSADGRWYRSPYRLLNSNLYDNKTSSPDMDIGIHLYAITTHDVAGFERWLNWIDANTPCAVKLEGECKVRWLPRFCPHENCTIRPEDMKLIRETASFLNIELPNQLAKYDNTLDTLLAVAQGTAPILARVLTTLNTGKWIWNHPECALADPVTLFLHGIEDCAETFVNDVLVTNAVIDLAVFNGPYIIEIAAIAFKNISLSDYIYFGINGLNHNVPPVAGGFPLHLMAVRIFLLRIINKGDQSRLNDASAELVNREPLNPFFLYLRDGRSSSTRDLTYNLCPANENAIMASSEALSDWAWQREDSEAKWLKSSLWDCMFMVNLLNKNKTPSLQNSKQLQGVLSVINMTL